MRRYRCFSSAACAAPLLVFILVSPGLVRAEEHARDDDTPMSDALLSWSGDDGDVPEAGEFLSVLMREAAAFRANPLDLNAALVHELARIPGLDPADAAAIVALRREKGGFDTVEDLAASPRFSSGFVRAIRPYVTCGQSSGALAATSRQDDSNEITWSVRVRSSWRVDPGDRWGMRSVGDVGDAAAPFARFRLAGGEAWRAGVSFERDPWERQLFDHTAFHASWRAPSGGPGSYRLSCEAGDVLVDWGQGLLFAGGSFTGVATFPRRSDRARGYDGAGEVASLRGAHIRAGRGPLDVALLATRTQLDATMDEDGLASSLRTSGHHRTDGERSGMNTLTETCLAGRLSASPMSALDVGCTALSLVYTPGLARGDPERQRFRFHGEELSAASFDVRCSAAEWVLGAEGAMTSFGGHAFVVAARVRRGSVRARFGCGHLSRGFWLPRGGGLPGVSGGQNGTCGWMGFEYEPVRSSRLRAEMLVSGRPWRSYHEELPDVRHRTTLGAEARVAGVGTFGAELRVRTDIAGDDADGDDPQGEAPAGGDETHETGATTATRVRLSLRTAGSDPLRVTFTTVTSTREGEELGRLRAISARWETSIGDRSLLSVGATSATSWGSVPAIVQYEPRLPGEFALRTLNASGARWYIRLKIGASGRMGISIRLSGGPGRGEYALGASLDLKG